MGRHNDLCSFDTLFCSTDKAVALETVGAALIGSTQTRIGRGNAFYTRRDACPGCHLLREQCQLITLTCQRLLRPESEFGESTCLLCCELPAGATESCSKPTVRTKIAATFSEIRHRKLCFQR